MPAAHRAHPPDPGAYGQHWHPVAGDEVYGPKAVLQKLGGQCLHAKTLGFLHPATGEYLSSTASSPLILQLSTFAQKGNAAMIDSLRDLLVVSDMDNTLLTAMEGVPACNRATIELFRALGGRFTVATGRPPASIRAALGGTRLSCPAIACGGSVLYDLEADRALEKSFFACGRSARR